MVKMSEAFPSKYLRAADLRGQEAHVTIRGCAMENLGDNESKPVLYFNESQKGLVVNKTNSNTMVRLYGDDTDAWTGKQLILFAMPVEMKGEMVEGLRVRGPQQAALGGGPPLGAPAATPAPVMPAQPVILPGQGHPFAPGGAGNPPPQPTQTTDDLDDEIPF